MATKTKPREKPPPKEPERDKLTPLERLADLTKRLISVPKEELDRLKR